MFSNMNSRLPVKFEDIKKEWAQYKPTLQLGEILEFANKGFFGVYVNYIEKKGQTQLEIENEISNDIKKSKFSRMLVGAIKELLEGHREKLDEFIEWELIIVSLNCGQVLSDENKRKALEKDAPILIKRDEEFSVYGCSQNEWKETELKLRDLTDLQKKLLYSLNYNSPLLKSRELTKEVIGLIIKHHKPYLSHDWPVSDFIKVYNQVYTAALNVIAERYTLYLSPAPHGEESMENTIYLNKDTRRFSYAGQADLYDRLPSYIDLSSLSCDYSFQENLPVKLKVIEYVLHSSVIDSIQFEKIQEQFPEVLNVLIAHYKDIFQTSEEESVRYFKHMPKVRCGSNDYWVNIIDTASRFRYLEIDLDACIKNEDYYVNENKTRLEKLTNFRKEKQNLLKKYKNHERLPIGAEIEILDLCEAWSVDNLLKDRNEPIISFSFGFFSKTDSQGNSRIVSNYRTASSLALAEDFLFFPDQLAQFELMDEFKTWISKGKTIDLAVEDGKLFKIGRCHFRKDLKKLHEQYYSPNTDNKELAEKIWNELKKNVTKYREVIIEIGAWDDPYAVIILNKRKDGASEYTTWKKSVFQRRVSELNRDKINEKIEALSQNLQIQ